MVCFEPKYHCITNKLNTKKKSTTHKMRVYCDNKHLLKFLDVFCSINT